MAPTTSADNNTQWPPDRIRRVLDVSTNNKNPQETTVEMIRERYQAFGPISNIFPWLSNARKAHFYVEFQSQVGCDKARETAVPGFNPVGVLNDSMHTKRLISLSTQMSNSSNHRYSPYELRSVSTSRASLPVAAGQGGHASSQQGDQNHPHSSPSNLPYDPNSAWGAMFPDNGDESVTSKDPPIAPFRLSPPTALLHSIPETIDIPILGEKVKFPANSALSSSGITALLRSTSGHAMLFGSEGTLPFIPNPTLPSTQNTPSSRSSELSVEEMLEVLTETRNNKREETGQDGSIYITNCADVLFDGSSTASTSATGTRPPRQFQIHPKFDFKQHIMSGRFLNPNYANNGRTDESVNQPSFQLTPLQSYFADIYSSLQTELHHTKRRNRQDLLLIEKQRVLTEQYKQEAADERNARRSAEEALGALKAQCDRSEADASRHQLAAQKAEEDLREAKEELETLKHSLDQLGFTWSVKKGDRSTR